MCSIHNEVSSRGDVSIHIQAIPNAYSTFTSKYQHKRALVLTARKLVRLVHALLTKNVPYVRPRTTVVLEEADWLQ